MQVVEILRRIVISGRKLLPLQAYWIALVRVSIGVFFCITGATKLFDPGARQEMVQTLASSGIPFPEANALFVSIGSSSCVFATSDK
ncbi:MAG: DoxX family membrane protein [Myxococcota bacterium]